LNLLKATFGNAVQNIVRNKLVNFLCFGIIAFTLLIFGIFDYITYNLEAFTRGFSKNIKAIFYFHDDVRQGEVELLMAKLKENLLVKDVGFTSKNQAEVDFSRQFPELKYILSEFKNSPFPASIEVEFSQEYAMDTKMVSLIEDIEKLDIVESKQVNIDWAKKIIVFKRFISVMGLFLSLILIFVSGFIIFNVIKISIFFRKDEINVLRLVGATDWYIKFPFIIEGAFLGFFGSLMAGGLLFITLKLFPLYATFVFDIVKGLINFKTIPSSIFIKLIVLGTAIGLFSSFISARQFLKVPKS
jgi:cell division transport system permease protein